ncbi:hypothetical protein FRC10_011775 [Ceratobasidium sp. 414]|nr:hypothetical protein FRC10_011775 [Ceratobasidium sp. 414]
MLPQILTLFCSSACRVVRAGSVINYGVPWITDSDSNRILAAILPNSAGLQHLDLFTKADHSSLDHWANLATVLNAMVALRSLGLGSDSLCDSVLAAAGQIPELQVLTLRFYRDSNLDAANLHVPADSFHKLSHLVVRGAWPRDLFHLVQLRPLVAGIQSVVLDVFEGSRDDLSLEKAVVILRENAKYLEDLDLCFPLSMSGPYEIRSGALIPKVSQIPAKRIGLRNVRLRSEHPFDYFLASCATWRATLTHLVMPDQPASPHELQLLAKFSVLEVLSINIQVVDVPQVSEIKLKPISGKILRLESYFLLHHLRPRDVEQLALFLLTCWDDLTLVMARRTLQLDEMCDRLDGWVYDGLLKELSHLKGRDKTTNTAQWK